MIDLMEIGWSPDREANSVDDGPGDLVPARVVEQQRSHHRVWAAEGELDARPSGRLRHESSDPRERPVVGDWVLVAARTEEGAATIHRILPRRTALHRKVAGVRSSAQVVAANLDVVFLVTSLNGDLNPRRIERTLAVIWESGAAPVVVLSKADLCDEVEERCREAEGVAVGAPVLPLSAVTGEGLEALEEYLVPRTTVGLIGSSGVGKSTLVNRLAGEEILAVQEIRGDDDKGRHTTSHRQLIRLPSGALVVDTPGMREIGLFDAEEGIRDAFSDVEAIAEGCRFRDCGHRDEPGCAVRGAIESGALDEDRYAAYVKLRREMAFQHRRTDIRARLDERRRWKKITMDYRKREKDRW